MSGTLCCKFVSEFGLKIWWMIYQYTIFYWLLFFLSLALLKVFSHHTNSPDWFSMQFPFREHFIDTKVLTYILIILFSWLCLRTREEILSRSLMRLNGLASIDTGRGQTEVNCWSSWSLLPQTKLINKQSALQLSSASSSSLSIRLPAFPPWQFQRRVIPPQQPHLVWWSIQDTTILVQSR